MIVLSSTSNLYSNKLLNFLLNVARSIKLSWPPIQPHFKLHISETGC